MPDIKPPAPILGADKKNDKKEEVKSDLKRPGDKKKGSFTKTLLIIIIIAVIVLVGLYLVSKYTKYNVLKINNQETEEVSDDPSGWSAVFLSNGQVYFGMVDKRDNDHIVLTDVFYLQVTSQIQPADQEIAQQDGQNVSLVKLGNELHGPRDGMDINMDHVLFTEELKQSSRVVEAIIRYEDDN